MYKPEEIKVITEEQLPQIAVEYFRMRPELSGYRDVADYDSFMTLQAMSHYAVYFTMADRSYPVSDQKNASERHIYAVDVTSNGQIAGHGSISNSMTSDSPYTKGKPLVLNIETDPNFLRQGYGRRRYSALNAVSLLVFGNPINSREKGNMLSTSAERTWQSLVREGLAESYEEPNVHSGKSLLRYRFKTPT